MTTKICLTRSEILKFVELAHSTPEAVARLVRDLVLTPELMDRIEKASGLSGEIKIDYRVSQEVERILLEVRQGLPGASVSGLVRALLATAVSRPAPPAPTNDRPVGGADRRGAVARWIVCVSIALALAFALAGWGKFLIERSRATDLEAALAAKEAERAKVAAELARDQVLYDQARVIFDWADQDPVRSREIQTALKAGK